MQYVFVENKNINENKSRVFVFAENPREHIFVSISRNMFSVFIFEKNKTSRFFFFFLHENIKANFIFGFSHENLFFENHENSVKKKIKSFPFFSLSFASGKMKIPKTTCLDAHDLCAPSAENPDALKIFFTEL